LQDARQKFRSVLVEATVKLDELVKKIGKAVEDSKPYWEARRVARQAQLEAQRATQDFQRATEVLRAAKETISLAEQRLLEDDKRQFDSAWQEMLNHATQRVIQTCPSVCLFHILCPPVVNSHSSTLHSVPVNVNNCSLFLHRPYFELKAKYYVQLEHLKKTVDDLQAKLALAKGEYKTALKNLEMISDEIHERRRSAAMGPRGCGVGAEGSNTSVEDLSTSKPESDTISSEYRALLQDCRTSYLHNPNARRPNVQFPRRHWCVPVPWPRGSVAQPICAVGAGGSPGLGSVPEAAGFNAFFAGDRAEGAENKTSDRVNKNRSSTRSGSAEGLALENRMKQLSLQCMKIKEGICAGRKAAQIG
ncbi:3BP5 protein, partial [Columbina picui]|nr:3BP5 protein [Columbina picui]